MFWLAEGDTNSKFFHASATVRKKSNHISFLKDDDGEVVSNHNGICALVRDYFSKVFAGSDRHRPRIVHNEVPVITDSQNANLIADLTFEEFT